MKLYFQKQVNNILIREKKITNRIKTLAKFMLSEEEFIILDQKSIKK